MRPRNRRRRTRRTPLPWPHLLAALLGVVLVAGVTLLLLPRPAGPAPLPSATPAPTAAPQKGADDPWVLAFHYRPSTLSAETGPINALCPTWFYLQAGEDGTACLQDLWDMGRDSWDPTAYVAQAHARGAQVWGCVVSFDPEVSRQVVTGPLQDAFVQRICQWYETCQLDGINFDFEKMDPADAAAFTALVGRVKQALPAEAVVSVCITVPLGYDAPNNWYQCYDRAGLAGACDYLVMMTYDSATVASCPLDWAQNKIDLALQEIPPQQLIIALPLYGSQYLYENDGETLTAKRSHSAATLDSLLQSGTFTQQNTQYQAMEWRMRGAYVAQWAAYRYVLVDQFGTRHEFYADRADTIAQKSALVPQYGLGGVGAWQLNQGNPAILAALAQGAQAQSTPQP